MNKTVKRILALTMTAALSAAVFAGCGNGSGANDGKTLKIGGMGPLTGSNASYGTSVKNGAQIAVDEINAAGGINGIKLEWMFEDDQSKSEVAVNAYNTLMDKGMQVLLGAVTSAPCIAVTEKSKQDGILQVTPSGSQIECAQYDNCFRICFTDPMQGKAMADYIAEKLGSYKKIGIIYDKSSDYSTGITNAFVEEAKAKGLTITAQEAFTDQSNTDFKVQLQKVKDSGADALFLPIYYQEAASIIKQAKTSGVQLPIIGCDGLDGLVKQMGSDTALIEGVLFLAPFIANDPAESVQKFTKAYQDKFGGATPDQFAADAYDGVYVIKAAMEKAAISDTNDKELNKKLIAAMTQIKVDGLTGTMTFDAKGEPNKAAKVVEIKGGKYTAKA